MVIGVVFALSSPSAHAHEYWLDPVGSDWAVGDTLGVDVRNGERFVGTAYPFDPTRLQVAQVVSDQGVERLAGRLGDYPALNATLRVPGLHLLRVDTRASELNYPTFEDFDAFLSEHALGQAGQRHQIRDLPLTDITERFSRFSKVLVAVGESATQQGALMSAAQQAQGQTLELVPLNNPLGTDIVSVQLLLEGRPLPERQVELWHRDSRRQSSRVIATTDELGKVRFDVSADGDYLLNSVWLMESDDGSVHWESLWASLVFER